MVKKAKRKQRVFQHIMEDDSIDVIKRALPKEWVYHDYRPDYGIDAVIEIFKNLKNGKAETLGEHIYIQIKSVKKIKKCIVKKYSRYNVEKSKLSYDKSKFSEIEVVKFVIDTSELCTVQAMGAGMPVLLFLVDLETETIYYLCLNDYIDKILVPEDPSFSYKKTKTISIPAGNIFHKGNDQTLIPIKFYAKRSKLYSAFTKFNYQYNELRYNLSKRLVLHFLSIIKEYDFWKNTHMWTPIKDSYERIIEIEKLLMTHSFPSEEHSTWDDIKNYSEDMYLSEIVVSEWHTLCNLSNMYEENCREWFLPTYYAVLLNSI